MKRALADTAIRQSASSDITGQRRVIVCRIALALLGGYGFTWGFVAFGMAGLVSLGMDFHEAEHAVMLLAFLIFLAVFLWAFAGRHLLRIGTVLIGGGMLMTLAAWFLQRSLLG